MLAQTGRSCGERGQTVKRCILEGGSAGLPDGLDLGTEGKIVVQDDSGGPASIGRGAIH